MQEIPNVVNKKRSKSAKVGNEKSRKSEKVENLKMLEIVRIGNQRSRIQEKVGNVIKIERSPRLKYPQHCNDNKTEMSPKLKCHHN